MKRAILTAGLVAIVAAAGAAATQSGGCEGAAIGGEGERKTAITVLRLINSIQAQARRTGSSYLSLEALAPQMTPAGVAVPPQFTLTMAAEPGSYLASITPSEGCGRGVFTTQHGVIFEGFPIR